MNQSTHLKYQYDNFDHSICFHWLSCMTYASVITGSSRFKKMYMNFNRIIRTVNILFPHLEKTCRSRIQVHSSSTRPYIYTLYISRLAILLISHGTAVFLAPPLSSQCTRYFNWNTKIAELNRTAWWKHGQMLRCPLHNCWVLWLTYCYPASLVLWCIYQGSQFFSRTNQSALQITRSKAFIRSLKATESGWFVLETFPHWNWDRTFTDTKTNLLAKIGTRVFPEISGAFFVHHWFFSSLTRLWMAAFAFAWIALLWLQLMSFCCMTKACCLMLMSCWISRPFSSNQFFWFYGSKGIHYVLQTVIMADLRVPHCVSVFLGYCLDSYLLKLLSTDGVIQPMSFGQFCLFCTVLFRWIWWSRWGGSEVIYTGHSSRVKCLMAVFCLDGNIVNEVPVVFFWWWSVLVITRLCSEHFFCSGTPLGFVLPTPSLPVVSLQRLRF